MDKKEEPKEEEKKQKWYHKKQKHKHPNDDEQKQKQRQQSTVKSKSKISKTSTTTSTTATSDTSFKPSSEVKGLKFGGQFIVKSFTIRRAGPLELLRLLSLPPPTGDEHHHHHSLRIFPSTVAFLPTNFTILAHHAWHTLTLGLGTNKSKVLITVFESESLRSFFADRIWPQEIPLGEVNRRILRGLAGCELARFKFRKGCLTFYVYAVRREGAAGFERAADLRAVLEAVVALRDFLDHTAMLAMPSQRSINYASSCNNSTNTNININCSASNNNSNSSAKQQSSSAAKCSRPPPVAMAH